jgi:Ala-tRNA(Pro) deacylase
MTLSLKTLNGHEALLAHLDRLGVRYRSIPHPAEGQTARASALRGHPVEHAAKCLVVAVGSSLGGTRYANCVVPGHRRVDFRGLCRLLGGISARMAPAELAGELTGCPMGAVTPFSFHPELSLMADPSLFEVPELVFNAGRLDLSVAMTPEDYRAAAQPMLASIAV